MTATCSPRRSRPLRLTMAALSLLLVISACSDAAAQATAIKVGLIAPLSGGSAASGVALQRGILLAIDDINAAGGVLGRPFELVVRDVANDGPAGVAALDELLEQEGISAVFGGIYSPVMLAQLDLVHERGVPLLDPWGSHPGITQNGRHPNYAFRVSVSDDSADEFLARYALDVLGAQRPAIIADTSAWGDSNVAGLSSWLERLGTPAVAVTRFAQGETDMTAATVALQAGAADVLLMVANAPEGAAIVRGLDSLGWDVPVVSHWGISGGQFVDLAGREAADGVFTLQTFSFHGTRSELADEVAEAYSERFGVPSAEDILAPVGVAHGYDGMRLLASAIESAASMDGSAIRSALEDLAPFEGLVKHYAPAFGPGDHDALDASDYMMAVWREGELVPADTTRLP